MAKTLAIVKSQISAFDHAKKNATPEPAREMSLPPNVPSRNGSHADNAQKRPVEKQQNEETPRELAEDGVAARRADE
jgi:hypothetical protein